MVARQLRVTKNHLISSNVPCVVILKVEHILGSKNGVKSSRHQAENTINSYLIFLQNYVLLSVLQSKTLLILLLTLFSTNY